MLNLLTLILPPLSYWLAFQLRFFGSHEPANLSALQDSLPWLWIWGLLLLHVYDFWPYRQLARDERNSSIIIVVLLQLLGGMALTFFLRQFAFPRTVFFLAALLQILFLFMFTLWQERTRKEEEFFLSGQDESEIAATLLAFWQEGKTVLLVPTLERLLVLGSKIELRQGQQVLVLRSGARTAGLKRLLDITVSSLLLLLSFPLLILIAFLIWLDSPGPVIYRQRRVTLGGRVFWLYKFRTMHVDAEALTGPVLATQDDPRITRVGRWLRRYRLDELPQLWNVLKGDMSLVGPRPERPEFVERYLQEIPGYGLRHCVRAGLTGLAQVSAGYDLPASQKLIYDLAYISNWSLWEDIKILFQTLRHLTLKGRAR